MCIRDSAFGGDGRDRVAEGSTISGGGGALEYTFVNSFPLAINSMPVSYDTSSLLKCTVSLSYVRYILKNLHKTAAYTQTTPRGQARFNAAGLAGGIVNAAVDRLTGNDLLGDIAGGFAEAALGDIPFSRPAPMIPPSVTPPRP